MIDGEPFRAHEARRRIRTILVSGVVGYDLPHFQREAKKDGIDMMDVTNVLRCGTVEEAEHDNGAWRYRVRTQKFCVVVEFVSDDEILLITTWRWKS